MRETEQRHELAERSEQYRQLLERHRSFDLQLGELQRRSVLSAPERLEQTRLKKLKLKLKDEMAHLARQLGN